MVTLHRILKHRVLNVGQDVFKSRAVFKVLANNNTDPRKFKKLSGVAKYLFLLCSEVVEENVLGSNSK